MKSNQFLDNFQPSILDKILTFYYKMRGVQIGENSYILFGATLERNLKNISIGKNVIIKPNARICTCNISAEIKIGNNVTIGHYTFIYCSKKITIQNNVMIAPFNYIVDSNHDLKKNELLIFQKNILGEILIEDDVWIGQGCTILKNSTISKGTVIGSKSLVNSITEEMSIYGGIPIKKIGVRR